MKSQGTSILLKTPGGKFIGGAQTDSSGKTYLSIVEAEGEALQLEVVYEESAKKLVF